MMSIFPHNISVDEVRNAITVQNMLLPSTSFIEAKRDGFVIFNYIVAFPETFGSFNGDPANDRHVGILRECRGLTFCEKTGNILARKFHKFRNVNENEECQSDRIDWWRPHHILAKLDGSMITPILIDDELQWHTKMGATDVAAPAAEFARQNPAYEAFSRALISDGYTPNAEWTSLKQRIVLSYPQDNIVFTAARDNETGEYMPYDELVSLCAIYGVPVVDALPCPVGDIDSFITNTRELKDAEGYVIAFANGERYKVKADDYIRVHRAKNDLLMEKNVVAIIANDQVDDFMSVLPENDREALQDFQEKIAVGLARKAAEIDSIVADAKQHMDKKTFAMTVAPNYPSVRTFLCSVWDGHDATEVLRAHIRKNTGSQPRVDDVRFLWGTAQWSYGVVTGD